ncbi:PREDICTED: uncharacterized protein LOC109129502 [Camelina sativa]|uniref:uroporphyrinogen-III C-methyltransferase n=1 Tax=Camelina sativa TaxID=90675 RepID=A0ABM1R2S2_CAMSA|nr:PREDICTED: uncharacterized protein LOC109129502 [Camelina sativa]
MLPFEPSSKHSTPFLSISDVRRFFNLLENDIASQLPELKKLLSVLRENRVKGYKGGDCGPRDVYLVGTGPGDPELLTLKAVRVIQSADLFLYDRLLSNDVLELVAPVARLLYVGKTAGITAASGIAAELGIPLTHRGVATSVRFLTGHSRKGGTDPLFVAENAADPNTTLVVYVGLGTLPSLAQ